MFCAKISVGLVLAVWLCSLKLCDNFFKLQVSKFLFLPFQLSILWAVANSIQIPIVPALKLRDLCPEHKHSLYRVAGRSSESVMELCMVECQLGSGCILSLMRLEMLTHSYSYSGWLKCNAMCATSTYCTCTHTQPDWSCKRNRSHTHNCTCTNQSSHAGLSAFVRDCNIKSNRSCNFPEGHTSLHNE